MDVLQIHQSIHIHSFSDTHLWPGPFKQQMPRLPSRQPPALLGTHQCVPKWAKVHNLSSMSWVCPWGSSQLNLLEILTQEVPRKCPGGMLVSSTGSFWWGTVVQMTSHLTLSLRLTSDTPQRKQNIIPVEINCKLVGVCYETGLKGTLIITLHMLVNTSRHNCGWAIFGGKFE